MKNFLGVKRTIIIDTISALFILLFVYTAINKLIAIRDLRSILKDYPLIGNFSEIVAWGLPTMELIVAGFLLFPRTKLLGLLSSLVLIATFTIYLIYILAFSPTLPCSCGGMLETLTWPQHLIFNIVFILLGLIAIWLFNKEKKSYRETQSPPVVFT